MLKIHERFVEKKIYAISFIFNCKKIFSETKMNKLLAETIKFEAIFITQSILKNSNNELTV